jgi:RNA polymerase sigma-70 factor (ECF subfamily)
MTAFSADDLSQHADAMRALARDLLRDPALADDAVQQACVTALTRPPAARIAVGAWLRAVVRSCALDLLRSQGRRQRREQRVAAGEPITSGDTAERLELQAAIVAAVRALGEPYCTAVWLRYFEGRTPGEIAAQLGEPVKTIKTRLWRALQLLRTRLDGRPGGRERWFAAAAPLARLPLGSAGLDAAGAAGTWLMQGKKLGVAAAAVLVLLTSALLWRPGAEAAPIGPSSASTASAGIDPANAAAAKATEPGGQREDAAAPAAVVSPYGSLAVHVRWHDATPAPDVAVTFVADGEPQLDRNETRAVSDAAGVARAEALHAGSVRLTSDRGGELRAEVVAGEAREVEFVLACGLDVTGTVVDESARAVPGARIVLVSGRVGMFGGRAIGTADPNGAFAVRAVDPRWSLRAEAPGYAPSAVVDLERVERVTGATSVNIALHLLHRGGGVAGKVVDEQGRGIAGAFVAIGKGGDSHWSEKFADEVFDAAVAVTDENGGFRCDCLAPGVLPIAARADGYADVLSEVKCAAGATEPVTLVLARGVTVHGCVRDEQGAVVAGAVIRALATPDEGASVDAYPRRAVTTVRLPETRSDAAGLFRLQFLPPGTLHLLAAGPGKETQFQGVCRATLVGRAGDEVAWNPELVVGRTIRIALVDEQGRPRFGLVQAIPEQPSGERVSLTAMTERLGALAVFKDCADVSYTVAAHVPLAGEAWKWIYQTGVRPGDPIVRLVLPDEPRELPPGSVSGTFVDAGNRLGGAAVKLSLCSRGSRRDLQLDKGRFRCGDLPPGRYFVWAQTLDGVPIASGPWFEVQSGQHRDAGELATEPGGSVCVTVRVPPGGELGAPRGFLGERYQSCVMRWDGEHLVASSITPGRHPVRLLAKGWHATPRHVEVVAGRTTELTIDAVPAIERQLEFVFPLTDDWKCDFVLRDAQGRVVAEMPNFTAQGIGPFAYVAKRDLPVGEFTLEANLDGKITTWPIDLRASVPAEKLLRFSLRTK